MELHVHSSWHIGWTYKESKPMDDMNRLSPNARVHFESERAEYIAYLFVSTIF